MAKYDQNLASALLHYMSYFEHGCVCSLRLLQASWMIWVSIRSVRMYENLASRHTCVATFEHLTLPTGTLLFHGEPAILGQGAGYSPGPTRDFVPALPVTGQFRT